MHHVEIDEDRWLEIPGTLDPVKSLPGRPGDETKSPVREAIFPV
jgi:hypothetical protein